MRRLDFRPSLFLAVGILLMLISNGRVILPLAAWLAPVGWLVFIDRSRASTGLLVAFVAYLVVTIIQWRGLIPAPGWIYYLITFIYAVFYFIPFVLHRLLTPRLQGVLATLMFPVGWVAIEFVFHRWITPYGSWFSLAYTQTDFVALLQISSVTGIAGVSFMIVWFAAIVAWILGVEGNGWRIWKPAVIYGTTLIAILVYGEIRMDRPLQHGETIRTASLVPNADLLGRLEDALTPARRGVELSDTELEHLVEAADVLNDDLIERTRREAEAGARLITWAETAGRILSADEAQFLNRLTTVAAEFGTSLIIGYGVFHPDDNPPLENKVAAIDRDGSLAWEYQKAHPIVGAESGFIRAGDGIIRVLEADFGRVGAVICHDLDFPELLLSAANLNLDLVVGPSADWSDITPLHANMAMPRSIEGGFALLRPTSGGRSVAVDAFGRTVAAVDFPEDSMVAYISPDHTFTLYSAVGDLFAWMCVGTLIGLFFCALSSRKVNSE